MIYFTIRKKMSKPCFGKDVLYSDVIYVLKHMKFRDGARIFFRGKLFTDYVL